MKKAQNYMTIILLLTMSSCFQNNSNSKGLIGNLKDVAVDKRTCLQIPIQSVINEDRNIDIIKDSIKIWVQSYDFFEIQTNKEGAYDFQRIDIAGSTNENIRYQAILEFNDCYDSYKEPLLIPADHGSIPIIKMYYPKSKLKSILHMLENKHSVLLHYHCWEIAGKWAGLSYQNKK